MSNVRPDKLPRDIAPTVPVPNAACSRWESPMIMLFTSYRCYASVAGKRGQYATLLAEDASRGVSSDTADAVRGAFAVRPIDIIPIILVVGALAAAYFLQKILGILRSNENAAKKAHYGSLVDKVASVSAGCILWALMHLCLVHRLLYISLVYDKPRAASYGWKTPGELNFSFFYIIYPLYIATLLILSWRARKVLSNTDWTPVRLSRYTAILVFFFGSVYTFVEIIRRCLYVLSFTPPLGPLVLCAVNSGLCSGLLSFIASCVYFRYLEPESHSTAKMY